MNKRKIVLISVGAVGLFGVGFLAFRIIQNWSYVRQSWNNTRNFDRNTGR